MKNKIKYTNEQMGRVRVVQDFLPPPDQLALREDNVKVTISLSKSSVEFFKKQGRLRRTSYQKMIRRLLDVYAERHTQTA